MGTFAQKDATEDSRVAYRPHGWGLGGEFRPRSRHGAHMHVNKYCCMFVAIEGRQVSHEIVCIENELTR